MLFRSSRLAKSARKAVSKRKEEKVAEKKRRTSRAETNRGAMFGRSKRSKEEPEEKESDEEEPVQKAPEKFDESAEWELEVT